MTPKTATPSAVAPAPVAAAVPTTSSPITLSIDIGGSGLKAMLLDPAGKPVSERQRVVTPEVPAPDAVLAGLHSCTACFRASTAFRLVSRA